MEASTTDRPFSGWWVWTVDVWVWIVEARCWVLRNRAGPVGTGLFWFFWVTCRTGRPSTFVGGGWCGGVAGADLHQTPGGDVRMGCVFASWWVFSWVVVVRGWCSCPYFENCIVDASIFVVFCCVTSY
jgi:hypothetical protein